MDTLELAISDASILTDSQSKADSFPPIDSNTIIVVGSFSQSQNSDAMKSRLEELGWNVYEENVNKMVRIGVLPEEHENIDEVLGLIREKVENEAWVLKKNN